MTGSRSVTSFLVARCGLGVGEADRDVFMARSLEHMPYAVELAHRGDLSVAQLEVLTHARSRHPEALAADDGTQPAMFARDTYLVGVSRTSSSPSTALRRPNSSARSAPM